MLARELISKVVPPLKPSDKVARALAWMDEFKVSHLPVVDGREFIGIVSEDNILDGEKSDTVIASKEVMSHASVLESQHIYYVIRKLTSTDLSVVAVVDVEGKYLGCITLLDLVVKFEELAAINQPGGIIVVNVSKVDYSLAQVAHVIESNNAKILSSYVFERPETEMLELTLKVNREEIGSIVQSLERYDYQVIAYFQESAQLEDLKGRYDELMRFINI
jgi:acetoin utilization protein AcuB